MRFLSLVLLLIPALSFAWPEFSENRVSVIYDRAVFDSAVRLVRRAQRSVVIDMYIFGGQSAREIVEILHEKQKEGVSVRVMLDRGFGIHPLNLKDSKPLYHQLIDYGIPVKLYPRHAIDHNKYIVIDETEAMVGSSNFGTLFLDFHDLMFWVKGPVAHDLQERFESDWSLKPTGAQIELRVPMLPRAGFSSARVVSTEGGQIQVYPVLEKLLRHSSQRIWVQMHELSDERALKQLVAAKARGVDVRVLVDPWDATLWTPVLSDQFRGVGNALALDFLIKAHVECREYVTSASSRVAHMKVGIMDRVAFAGSINWTPGGFQRVAETNLEIHGGPVIRALEQAFLKDWNLHSVPAVRPTQWQLVLARAYQGVSQARQ